MIAITEDLINAEAYVSEAMDVKEVQIEWSDGQTAFERFTVGQNEPNPWMNTTKIEVDVPDEGEVNLLVKDVSGKLLHRRSKLMSSGKHTIILTKSDVLQSGVLIYEVEYNDQVISKKMISIN